MRHFIPRLRRPLTPVVTLLALGLGAGCVTSEEGSTDEALATEESALLPLVGYTGYLNTRDLNHDGAPDLQVINVVSSTLGIRLNNGDGTFGDLVHYLGGITPTFLACDDFNNDEDLDVAVPYAVTNSVSVFLGNGDGTLQLGGSYPVADLLHLEIASTPFGIVTGDFNRDGCADIVTSNIVSNNVSSMIGRCDGTFEPPNTFPIMSGNTTGLTVFPVITVDVDGDDNLDLVTGGVNSITIMSGHGDGSFSAARHYHTGVAISCIEVADFDRDGNSDLVTSAIGTSNYSIMLGHGDGTFTLKESKSSGGIAGECMGVGDLNGDGELDLAIANTATPLVAGNVVVRLGNGDGTFGSPVGYLVGVTPWAASIVDFNRDGFMDVGVAVGGNTAASIRFGNGDGTLQPQVLYPM